MSEAPSSIAAGLQVTPTVKLVRPLNSGGMGAVWLAEHTGLKTQVVVKFMLDEQGANDLARARFSREAAAAAAVKSPHVVQMHDHGVTDKGVPFIVMEHLEGRDLASELEDGAALAPARVVPIVSQVARALAKVHAAGLLHRDIKPENIFLLEGEGEDFVKLLDFGIAKKEDGTTSDSTASGASDTKTGQIVGTPFYMSPEQVTAQKEIDARADLWSLGVVTYQLLTGVRPFEGPSFGALAVRIASGPLPKPSDANPSLPAAFDAWFAKACAREPKDRFASAKELAEALRAVFESTVSFPPATSSRPGKTVSVRPPDSDPDARPSMVNAETIADTLAHTEGAVSVAKPKEPKSRTPLYGAGALVVALLGAAIYVAISQSPPDKPVRTAMAAEQEGAASSVVPVPVPGSATASATATAPAPAPASATAVATATATATASASASASAPASARVGWRPPIATTNHVGLRPPASGETAPRPPSSAGLAPDVF